jgi:N6-L-threonylcarbamoyladenine synthase
LATGYDKLAISIGILAPPKPMNGLGNMGLKILGIETSCDDTAIGIVEDGRCLRSNVIASQIEMHARYGGIVPELASRQHILEITAVLDQVLVSDELCLDDLDAVAVTYGPGLAGSLITGLNFAKALAFALNVPLIGVNHLKAHIYASWLNVSDPEDEPGFPLACLVASGGHTDLAVMDGHGMFRLVGRTRDDAAGEAFDKAARILGLGFPGGPEIERLAKGSTQGVRMPRAWMKDSLDFSFSGVKTALLHLAQSKGVYPPGRVDREGAEVTALVQDMAAGFQESLVDVMVEKLLEVARRYKTRGVVLGGGVASNALLRQEIVRRSQLPVIVPPPILCTDNGAMIAACGFFQYERDQQAGLNLDIAPGLSLG